MKKTIYRTCPTCLPDSTADFDYAGHVDGHRNYKCRNCSHVRVVKTRQRNTEATPSQLRALIDLMDTVDPSASGSHECKTEIASSGRMLVRFLPLHWSEKYQTYTIGTRGKVVRT